jgi:sugar lactone lactonase YvrE
MKTANRELGQADLNHNMLNFGGPAGLDAPQNVAVDRSVTPNRLYVVDTRNNRVLGFADQSSLINGSPADLVIGQPDFFSALGSTSIARSATLLSPVAAAVDSSGNLYVADQGNNRVVEYDSPFAQCNGTYPCVSAGAQRVFGQSGSFSTNKCNFDNFSRGVSADSLCFPAGVDADSHGNLYVLDQGNGRVLEYNTPTMISGPGSNDTTADVVFGQHGSFTSSGCTDLGGTPSADTLCLQSYWGFPDPPPFSMTLAVDSADNLWVPDSFNARVLEYDQPLAKQGGMPRIPGHPGDTTADFVIGLGASGNNFDAGFCDQPTGATSLCHPSGVTVDPAGDVYVRDEGSDYFGVFGYGRVLGFLNPLMTASSSCPGCGDASADIVLGENGNFASAICTSPEGGIVDASSLSCADSIGLAADAQAAVFAADSGTNRVLKYDTPVTNQRANLVLGQTNLSQSRVNFLDARGLGSPTGIAVDSSTPTPHLYLADSMNNRVLGWRDAVGFANGASADLVIGQEDFESAECAQTSANTLCQPWGVAVDLKGNLFVADTVNSRVLAYPGPFEACSSFPCILSQTESPRMVFGQSGSFTSGGCGDYVSTTADSLCTPYGVAVDQSENVYIADTGNSRVLKYYNPLAPHGGRPGTPGHSGDTTADLVIGQGSSGTDFVASGCQGGPPDRNRLCYPTGLAIDGHGNLYVVQDGIWEYFKPGLPSGSRTTSGHAGDVTADVFFGGRGFDQNGNCLSGPDCLFDPQASTVDRSGNLFVADGEGRVLEYFNPGARGGGTPGRPGSAGDSTADVVLGQGGNFSVNACNGADEIIVRVPERPATATNLCFPSGVAVDPIGSLYVSDSGNHRVLAFDSMPMAGSLTVSPGAIDFGTVAENTTKRRNITLRNVTNKTGSPIGIVDETTASPFAVKKQCVGTLHPGRICHVTVTFTPTDTMPHTATLVINDNVVDGPQKEQLRGTGTAAR